MISADKAFIEIMGTRAPTLPQLCGLTTASRRRSQEGRTADALAYVLADLEAAVTRTLLLKRSEVSKDVMELMTGLRNDWNFLYPEN